jgi:thiamine kinase-like enzyme
MADLPDDTLIIALFRQGRLLKLLDQVTKADLLIYEQFGENSETITALTQLQNARERLNNSLARLVNLLRQVYELQPNASADLLNLLYQSVEESLLTADAIEATVKETKRDWNLP